MAGARSGDFAPFPVSFLEELNGGDRVLPYKRDERGVRPWIKPGTPGLMHRIGGIEKAPETGDLDYSPETHQTQTMARMDKVNGIANAVPAQAVSLGESSGSLAVVGWGSTFGPIHQAVRRARDRGLSVSHIHVRHIWPLPANLGELLRSFEHVLVPEMNTGQFKTVLRDQYLVDAKPLNKVSGQPFTIGEIDTAIGTFFDGIPDNEGGELPADTTQLPSIEAFNP